MASIKQVKSVKNNVSELIVSGVISILNRRTSKSWTGTMTQLDETLHRTLRGKADDVLPGSPSALRIAINKTVRKLSKNNIKVKFSRATDRNRTRYVEFVVR